MELAVTRILRNDVREHAAIERAAYINPTTIVKVEEDSADEDITNILFSWGEEINIKENVHEFKLRVEDYYDEEEAKRKNESLGL